MFDMLDMLYMTGQDASCQVPFASHPAHVPRLRSESGSCPCILLLYGLDCQPTGASASDVPIALFCILEME